MTANLDALHDDWKHDPFEQLLVHCRSVAALCLKTRVSIPNPNGAFIDSTGAITEWRPQDEDSTLALQDAMELIRLRAMAKATEGAITGAAITVILQNTTGETGLAIQIHTRTKQAAFILPISETHESLADEAEKMARLLPEGLCFFA